jgi:electron transfer flavoprotein alpha subunit
MSVLVIAEHDNQNLQPSSLSAITAAVSFKSDVHVLVAGSGCQAVAAQVALSQGVTKVLCADAPHYQHQLAEEIAPLVASLRKGYGAILAPSTTTGKNLIPRAAALLNVQPLSDVSKVVSADVFERSIYAGNVVATVQSSDLIKVMTIRTTAFDAAAASASAAPIEALSALPRRMWSFPAVEAYKMAIIFSCFISSRISLMPPWARPGQLSTQASFPTICRLGKPARW